MHTLKLLRPTVWENIHLLYSLYDLGVKVMKNVAQYLLHYLTYASTNFEVARSNGLGGDAFTRKLFDL